MGFPTPSLTPADIVEGTKLIEMGVAPVQIHVMSRIDGVTVARFAVPAADADAQLSASVSPDGRHALFGRGAAVHLLEAATGRPVQDWTGFGRVGAVRCLRDLPAS